MLLHFSDLLLELQLKEVNVSHLRRFHLEMEMGDPCLVPLIQQAFRLARVLHKLVYELLQVIDASSAAAALRVVAQIGD